MNQTRLKPTRRTLLRLLLGAGVLQFLPARLRASTPVAIEELIQDHAVEPRHTICRRYRASAYVHLFALPIFSRQDVGGGYAVVEEGAAGPHAFIGLQFAGGSVGERARGLNRVGLIQEAVIEQHDSSIEAAYFGFMVASGEKNMEQARKSLQTDTKGSIPYASASGNGRLGRFQCTVSRMPVPARFTWANFEQLNHDVRSLINGASETKRFDVPLDSATSHPDTFLYSIRRSILSKAPRMTNTIVYNGKRYVLSTEKQADKRMGQQLATRGVTHQPEAVWRMNGTTTETGTRQSTPFEIWFEKGDASGLPVRIEFHPKSFLKLVFEQSGAPEGPKFSYLLSNRSVPPREASR